MSRREVRVELGARSYSIRIGSGLLDEIGPDVRALLASGPPSNVAAVVTDSRVAPFYLDRVEASLRRADYDVVTIQIPEGEPHKNLAWLAVTYDRLIDGRVERGSPVVALGGGVVGDLGGFAAATYLRGVPLVQAPTTLLAQVDAAIGGKTAVNHAAGKNLIGAFHQPALVAIDVDTLRTLPRREYVAGLAEVVKYGAILDPALFDLLERETSRILALDLELVGEVVATCARLKAMVVEEDEREGDFRAVLNFCHTVGHAIETLTEYRTFLHGEAVAIGMVAAARLSRRLGLLAEASERRLRRLLDRLGLPVEVPADLAVEAIALAIEADKKAAGARIKFVCLEEIGRTRFERMTAAVIAETALDRGRRSI
jgi:3-dehydroquinate synthase